MIEVHLPGLPQDTAAQQHSQRVGALGRMENQQQSQYDVSKVAKEAKATMTVTAWIGEDELSAVLNLMHTRNEADIIIVCPAYKAMLAEPKSLKMAQLKSSIEKIIGDRGIEHLVVIVTWRCSPSSSA